jgi:hypothetical protein
LTDPAVVGVVAPPCGGSVADVTSGIDATDRKLPLADAEASDLNSKKKQSAFDILVD